MDVTITRDDEGGESFDSFEDWLATQPEIMKQLVKEFPAGSYLEDRDGVRMYVLGWSETDAVILTPLDPRKDYEAAVAAKAYFCADHFRPCGCKHSEVH